MKYPHNVYILLYYIYTFKKYFLLVIQLVIHNYDSLKIHEYFFQVFKIE